MRLARLAALGAATTVVGCGFLSLDGLTGGDAGQGVVAPVDGSPQDGTVVPEAGGGEAGSDGKVPDDGPVTDGETPGTPVTIASAGGLTAPSGAAQEGHLVWTNGTKQWWFFSAGAADAGALAVASSSDFQTWTAGAPIALPGPPTDGRNLAAWAGTAGGQDVVDVAVSAVVSSTDRRHLHVLGQPSAGGFQVEALAVLGTTTANLTGLAPDGPATASASDGTIVDTSAWSQDADGGATGNEYAWSSATTDAGAPAFGPTQELEQVPGYVNARAVVPLPGGGVMALWEAGDVDPDPTNVSFATGLSTKWSPPAAVFVAAPQDPNDWSACSLGTSVHAVRHTSGGAWEHRVWTAGTATGDGGTAFVDGGTIGTMNAPAGTGVVVLCDATRVHVFAIAPDTGNPIRTTAWDGTSWAAWTDVVGAAVATVQRTWLTGAITPAGTVGLAWTQGTTVEGAIVGP